MTQAEEARKFYDRISGVYDVLADASEHGARTLGLRLLGLSGSERLLEIGCGTGHGLVEAAELLADGGKVFGADISPGMLEVAKKRVRKSAARDRIADLELADAKALPWEDGFFDAAFLSFTLELFSAAEIPAVLAEIGRVLVPGGRLGVVSLHDEGKGTAIVELYRFLHRHFPHIVDCQPIDARAHLERAGFEILASEGVAIWGLPVVAIVGRLAGSG